MSAVVVSVCAAAFACATPAFATAPPLASTTLPLSIAVADVPDVADAPDAPANGSVHPARDAAWIDAQIEEATRLFTKHASVRFMKAETRRLDTRHAHLETRADRDALAAYAKPGLINVFVVESLRDIDEENRMRMGVCWRVAGETAEQARRFVVVSSIAKPSVLAHELGHYHGLPHSKTRNNVMSYERDGGPIFFDAIQSRTLRESAAAYVRDGVLVPAALSR